MKIIIDGATFSTELEMHRLFAKKFDFGQCYGENLYALRDFASDIERPVEIVWKNSHISSEKLGKLVYDYVVEIFKDEENRDKKFGRTARFTLKLL